MTTGPTETGVDEDEVPVGAPPTLVLYLLDIGVASVVPAATLAKAAGRRLSSATRPVSAVLFFPPMVPARLQPGRPLAALAALGGRRRREVQRELGALIDRLLPAGVDLLLRHVDLTRMVREHVDVNSLIATVDFEAVVDQIDMATMATDIIATLDLPEIIRESTSAVSSETVRQVRMRGISADEAVARAAQRLRPRRGRTQVPMATGPAADGVPNVGQQVSRSAVKDPSA